MEVASTVRVHCLAATLAREWVAREGWWSRQWNRGVHIRLLHRVGVDVHTSTSLRRVIEAPAGHLMVMGTALWNTVHPARANIIRRVTTRTHRRKRHWVVEVEGIR